ncbi:hypothetical protein KA977_11755 [Candidatus Dependentiae bacterium]|nr:hypothetical protein [Candidatus Dependentiae bacterium]
MKDLKQLWTKINSKINVLIFVITALIFLDMYFVYAVYNSYTNTENFEKLNRLPPPKPFEKKEIPEIEPFDIENMKEIPLEYQVIYTNNIFVNPELKAPDPNASSLAVIDEIEEGGMIAQPIGEMPFLEGYTAKGLITGDNQTVGAVFIEGPGGMSYYGKEGRKLIGTNIIIKKIYKDRVILSQPGFKETTITFESEEFLSRWKRNDYVDPLKVNKSTVKPATASVPAVKKEEPEESEEDEDEE